MGSIPGWETKVPQATRCGPNNKQKLTLTIFQHTVQWHYAHSHCCSAISTIHLQNLFIFPTETLYPLHPNSSSLLPSAPGNHRSASRLYEFDCPRYLTWVESHTVLFLFRSAFFHLLSCLPGSTLWSHMSEFHVADFPRFLGISENLGMNLYPWRWSHLFFSQSEGASGSELPHSWLAPTACPGAWWPLLPGWREALGWRRASGQGARPV